MSDWGCGTDFGSCDYGSDWGSSSTDFSSNDYGSDWGASSTDFGSNDYGSDWGASSTDFGSYDYGSDWGSSSTDFGSYDYGSDWGSSSTDFGSYDYCSDWGSSSTDYDTSSGGTDWGDTSLDPGPYDFGANPSTYDYGAFLNYDLNSGIPSTNFGSYDYGTDWWASSSEDSDYYETTIYDGLNSGTNSGNSLSSLFTTDTTDTTVHDWGNVASTVGNAIWEHPTIQEYTNNAIESAMEWTQDTFGPDIINNPIQWVENNPWSAAGLGAAGLSLGTAYLNYQEEINGSLPLYQGNLFGIEVETSFNFNYSWGNDANNNNIIELWIEGSW